MKRFSRLWTACCVAACMALTACGGDDGSAATAEGGNAAQEEYEAALARESEAAQAEHESEMAVKESNTKPYGEVEDGAPNRGDGNGMAGLAGGENEEEPEETEAPPEDGGDAESGDGGAGMPTEDNGSGEDEEEEAEAWDPLDELEGQESLRDYYDVPDWNGQPWAVLNGNTPYFVIPDEGDAYACEYYEALDDMMRPGTMVLCTDATDNGQADYSAKPQNADDVPGWNDDAYVKIIADIGQDRLTATGGTGDGRLYYMRRLAGTGSTALGRKNTIVCTQYMGACGMDALDALVDEYIAKTGNKVLCRVTPVFLEDEAIARGVVYEAISIGDSEEDIAEGRDLCFNMFVYNVQPGIEIDYGTGASQEAASSTEYLWSVNSESFVLDMDAMQSHVPGCSELIESVELGGQELYYGTAASLRNWSDTWDSCSCMDEISKKLKKAR